LFPRLAKAQGIIIPYFSLMAKLKKAIKWLFGNFGFTAAGSLWVIITLRDNSRMENLDEWDYFETIFICLFFAAVFIKEIVVYRKKQKVRKMD
tara:strand:+ start:238 stop:516 length:279 start_codon:yes stop_codon:yes gene_type:complete